MSILTLALAVFAAHAAHAAPIDQTIATVERMPWDADVTAIAARHGLGVMNVTWEDTGRYKGSSVGPNISDMTIGVRDSAGQLHPMPVFRFDNFTDVTADLPADAFILPEGNQQGESLEPVTLTQMLKRTQAYLHDPSSWAGPGKRLWAPRDSEVLVSAQACFLPIPKHGEATFTPVIYNYQSSPGAPAVLTMVATQQGTSIQVVENDGGYMSQPLFFNADGERAPFTATRASDATRRSGGPAGPISAAGEDTGDVVLIIQVPLKHAAMERGYGGLAMEEPTASMSSSRRTSRSDVEAAVIGHGAAEGPFTEIHNLSIERDPRFPVRVTVQFYKATSNGVVSDADVADIRDRIDRIYAGGSAIGSLVVDGTTTRTTEWVTPPPTPTASWSQSSWFRAF